LGVNGTRRSRTPVASNTAFPIAAGTRPSAISAAPDGASSLWFWNVGSGTALRGGHVVTNGGRVLDLRSQGLQLEYYKPREGWMLNADVLQIGKGSRNRFTAEKFIDFFYRPEIVTRASEVMNFPIASRNVQATQTVRSLPDYDPSGELAGARFYDPTYWDTNTSRWTERVREIIAS
jgi:spermidine/putrescine transport system substrate-binding protein